MEYEDELKKPAFSASGTTMRSSIMSKSMTQTGGRIRGSVRASIASRFMDADGMSGKNIDSEHNITALLQAMDDKTLVKTIEEMQKTTRYLNLENQILINFLEKNDPASLEVMQNVLKAAQTVQERTSISSRRVTFTRASRSSTKSGMLFGVPSTPMFTLEQLEKSEVKGFPRVNIMQKMDIIAREMDEIKLKVDTLTKKSQITRQKLKSELEEMGIREGELQQTVELFESVFITGTCEKFTQKNVTEKFIRFMEELLKNIRLSIDKIRLRTSSLKVQYHKICGILANKKLIGENLQEVDFEQLQIENKHLVLKIDSRNLLLLELKRMNGHANLLLSNHKKLLAKKMEEMNKIKEAIAEKEQMTVKLDDECERVSIELDKTKNELDKVETRIRTYKAPDIIEYVKKKAELSVLKRNLKVWMRKKQIKDMALQACMREMRHATGAVAAHPSWLEVTVQDTKNLSDLSFHFPFETYLRPKKRHHPLKSRKI